MKKLFTIMAVALIMCAGLATRAFAACSGEVGGICIVLQDELGTAIIADANTTVRFEFEGADDDISAGLNPTITAFDGGGNDGGGMDGADGDIEISQTNVAASVGTPNNGNDWFYELESTSGYVNVDSGYLAYDDTIANEITPDSSAPGLPDGLAFTLKVTIQRQAPISTTLSGTTITLANTTGCDGAYADGGGSDQDGLDNGTFYYKCPATSTPDTVTITASKNGYLDTEDATNSISNGSQVDATIGVEFPYVITAQEELGNAITLTTGDTVAGLAEEEKFASGGSIYLAATAGPANIVLTPSGFVSVTSTNPYTYSAAGTQETVDFDGGADGPQADYSLKVLGATDELGNAVTISGSPFSATGFTIASQTVNGGEGYIAATPAAGALEITLTGYVTESVAVTPNTGAQQEVDYDNGDPGANAAAVDGDGLGFQIVLNSGDENFEDELANPLTYDNSETITVCIDSGCVTPEAPVDSRFNGAKWYIAPASTGDKWIRVAKAGYAQTIDGSAVTAATTAAVNPIFDKDDGDGMQFTLRVNVEDEIGNALTGATVAQTVGSTVGCTEDAATGEYYCPVPNGEGTAVSAAKAGYVTKNVGTAGNADETGAQLVQDLTDGSGNEVQFTLRVNVEDELAGALTGATVAQSVGSTVGCTEDGTTGQYYCAVPDGEATNVDVSKTGYVTDNAATAGNAAVAGPQVVQDLTDGVDPMLFTLRANIEDELGNAYTGATVAQSGGSAVSCSEDAATGQYYCAVPNAEGTALTMTKDGYVNKTKATAGGAAEAGPQTVQDLTDGVDPVQFTVRANIQEELGNAFTGGTVAQDGGSSTACTEDAATGEYYCAVPDGETTALTVSKAGYITKSKATAGNAAIAGPQTVQTMTDPADPVQFTLRVNVQEELGGALDAGTVAQTVGSTVGCTEDGATGQYYCAVPNGEGTAVSVAKAGYVTKNAGTAGNADVSGSQLVQDLTDGVDPVEFTLRVNVQEELGNALAAATVAQSVGSTVGCTEDGATGQYYCAVPDGEATNVDVSKAGYVTKNAGTAGNAAVAGPQVVQDLTDGVDPVQFTLRVNVEDEIAGALTGATVAQSVGSTVGCTEDGSTGQYYCAVPDGEATNVDVSKTGYVTDNAATAGNAAVAGPQVVQDLTDGVDPMLFTLRANIEDELGTAFTGATVVQAGGSAVSCSEDAATGQYYCAVPDGEGTPLTVTKAGYVTKSKGTAGAAAEVGPQLVQDLTDGVDPVEFTLRVNVEDELSNALAAGTVAQDGGSAVACTEDGATGQYYCPVPDGETTAVAASKAGHVTRNKTTAGNAAVAGPQVVQDLTAGGGTPVLLTLRVNVEDELGTALTGATLAQTVGSTVPCTGNGLGGYFCAVPDGEGTAVEAAKAGYVTTAAGSAGNADEDGSQVIQDMTASGTPVQFTLRVNLEEELGNALAGATVDQSVGSTVACTDNGSGSYFCPVPDGEATNVDVSKAGYVTKNAGTAGNAAEAGPQVVQDLTDGVDPLEFTLRANIEDEIAGALTGATVAQAGGSAVSCTEDGTTGQYYCAAPDGETTALTVAKAGYVNKTKGTAGGAAEAGPQTVQDMTDGVDPVLFTLRINAEDELANAMTGATVAQNGGSSTSCTEDAATGQYYCAVPDGETTAVSATKAGYVNASVATAGNAAVAGPQTVQDMTDGSGDEMQFTLRANIEDELGAAFTGGTVAQNGGSAVACTEDGATGQYYCPVPSGETTAVTASKAGYATTNAATAGPAAALGPQVVQDMTDGSTKEADFTLRATIQDELGNALTGATVAQSGGSAVACTEDGGTGEYVCPVPDGEGTAITASKAGYVTKNVATAGPADESGAQVTQDMTDGTGNEVQFTLRANIQDEIGGALTGATVAQDGGSAVACTEDASTGEYYCPAPDGETTALTVAKAGYVNKSKGTAGAAAEAGPQTVQVMTDPADPVSFTLRANIEDEIAGALTGATVAQAGGSTVSCSEDGTTGQYYCAAPNGETTALTIAKDGYVNKTKGTAGGAAEAGPQTVQDLTDGVDPVSFTLRANIEDELAGAFTGATVSQIGGSGVSCTEDAATGQYYCAVPDGETTALMASLAGYVTKSVATAGNAAVAGPQTVQDMTDGSGNEVQFTLRVNAEDELANTFTGGTVAQNGGSAVACTEDGVTGQYYCAVPDGETTAVTAAKAGYALTSVATAGGAAVAGPQVVQDMTDGSGNEVDFTLKVTVQDEIGNALTGGTLTQNGGSAVACTEDGATGIYVCPVPDGETTAITAAKDGYVTTNAATAGNADESGAQVEQDMTDGTGNELPFTLRVNAETEIAVALTGATISQFGGSSVACTEDGTTGQYYCPVPNGETTTVSAAKTGFVSATAVSLGPAATAGPQLVQDLTDGTGTPLAYTLRANIEDELGNVLTGGTVAQNGGSAVSCTEEGATGFYYCAVPDGETTAVSAAVTGYVTGTPADAGAAAEAGPQVVQDMTDGSGSELLFQIKADSGASNLEDIVGNALTYDGTETITVCTVDNTCTNTEAPVIPAAFNGTSWYIAPATEGAKWIKVEKNGFGATTDGTSIAAAAAGPVVNPTFDDAGSDGLEYLIKVQSGATYLEDELGNALTLDGVGETVEVCNAFDCGGGVEAPENIVFDTDAWHIAPATGGNKWIRIQMDGYIRIIDGASINVVATQVSPAFTQTDGDALDFTLKSTIQDELGSAFTGATVTADSGGTACTEDSGTPGDYYCPVPNGQPTDLSAAKTGFVTATKADAGNANETGAQIVSDISDGSGTEAFYQIKMLSGIPNLEDVLGNAITMDGTETITVCTAADCSGTEAPAVTNVFDTDTWYIAPATVGAKWIRVAKTGFATTIDGASITAAAGGPQVSPAFEDTAGDGLPIQATQIVITDPTDDTVDNTVQVTIEVQDALGVTDPTNTSTFTVNLSGSAVGPTITTGTIVSGAGTNAVEVTAVAGVVVLDVTDQVAETINITLTDTSATGMDVTSTQDLVFGVGAATQIALTDPTDGAAGSDIAVVATVMDQYNNTVATDTTQFTVTVDGDAVFNGATTGTINSGDTTNTVVVTAAAGVVSLKLNDSTPETVNLSLTDSASTFLDVTSTQDVVVSAGTGTQMVFLTAAETQTAGQENATAYAVQIQDAIGNGIGSPATDVTVNLSSTSTGTVEFRATSGGPAVTSLTIGVGTDTVSFFYVDTKEGAPTVTAAATGLTSGTLQPTINDTGTVATIPVDANEATTTEADTQQPTGQSSVLTVKDSTNTYTLATVKFPYTVPSVTSQQILADGTTVGYITVTVFDNYGNPITGQTVTLEAAITAGAARVAGATSNGVTVTPDSGTSDANGQVTFQTTASNAATADFQAKVNGTLYGSAVRVLFASSDTTAPTIDSTVSTSSLVNGDLIGSTDAVTIRVGLTDTGTGATGVDLTSIAVAVTDSGGSAVTGTTSTTGCTVATDCTITWTPAAAMTAGNYTITLTVEDLADNQQTSSWTVRVSSSNVLENIVAGAADGSPIFNPLSGGNMAITFQAPSAGTVSLEVYRRDGRLVYSTTAVVAPGFNEVLWNGRSLSNIPVANGVYKFRLRANLTTGVVEQTGKLAIFKQ